MILNLMRVEQLRVQDMIKRSFSEFHNQQESAGHRQKLEVVREKMRQTKPIECYLCSIDLEKYYEECKEFYRLREHIQVRSSFVDISFSFSLLSFYFSTFDLNKCDGLLFYIFFFILTLLFLSCSHCISYMTCEILLFMEHIKTIKPLFQLVI